MVACFWGEKGSRPADVATFRMPLAFRECAWSAEGHLILLIFTQWPPESGPKASQVCFPPADSEPALCYTRPSSGVIFYFDRQDVMFHSPCYHTL